MSEDRPPAIRRQVEITNALGLHMRPANKFVNLADMFQAEVRVLYQGREFNGKSILDLTGLAAEKGTRLEIEAWGPDAEAALAALAELIIAEFYEDEFGEERPAGPPRSENHSRLHSSPVEPGTAPVAEPPTGPGS